MADMTKEQFVKQYVLNLAGNPNFIGRNFTPEDTVGMAILAWDAVERRLNTETSQPVAMPSSRRTSDLAAQISGIENGNVVPR